MSLSQKLRVPLELGGDASYGRDAAAEDDAPAVRAADEIFENAIRNRASDVHLEPCSGAGRVRERVDGILREARRLPEPLFSQIVSRIKVLAGMDIADRRLPQDGRYTLERGVRRLDVRVASLPTIAGERLAIRLLDAWAAVPTLETLGMEPAMAQAFRRKIGAASGFVVACGPTGSGKTTTVYAGLSERNALAQHLCSVEDPVEARLPGIAQVQVNVRAGLDFPGALRAFLRQDPNAIMVGEMRDPQTAAVALSAALCGQLVCTTLHGVDAPGAIPRLLELGVPPRTLAHAASAIVGQRLIRQLCANCKAADRAGAAAQAWGIAPDAVVATARGCDRCLHSGYRGRSGLFELLTFDDALREAVERQASPARVRSIACENGYQPMSVAARAMLLRGETSLEELERVLEPPSIA